MRARKQRMRTFCIHVCMCGCMYAWNTGCARRVLMFNSSACLQQSMHMVLIHAYVGLFMHENKVCACLCSCVHVWKHRMCASCIHACVGVCMHEIHAYVGLCMHETKACACCLIHVCMYENTWCAHAWKKPCRQALCLVVARSSTPSRHMFCICE
jgi:hypothetical protein